MQGVVIKKISGSYTVHVEGRTINCAFSSRPRPPSNAAKGGRKLDRRPDRSQKDAEPEGMVTVGDHVRLTETRDGRGTILEVLPRCNKLARRSPVPMPSAHASEQVIVANLDQVVPVLAAANPAPRWNLLDRYLVSAESAGLTALVCITKLDLIQALGGAVEEEFWKTIDEYRQIGYPLVLTSAVTGQGLVDLNQALAGKLSAFLGQSGVGKTSLLNALEPELGLRVAEVSRVTGKGKHTTTHMEAFPLACSGAVVDTPGIREFGLWDIEEDDLALFFPEMRPFLGLCKFGLDCRHDEEPGCEVRRAVSSGRISPRRYQSYLRLRWNT
jgi:ribosome biogenesis GTPase